MAYTSIIPVRRLDRAVAYVQNREKTTRSKNSAASLEEAVDYAMNRDKTERDVFETGLGCDTATVFADMKTCKAYWRKLDGVQGYHLVQSFAPGESNPEQAHLIGLELAERLLGGKYQAVVTTHLNTKCLHNHIVWNSVALDTGEKYRSNAKSYYTEVRRLSDELCREHGLSIIQNPSDEKGKPYLEWQAEKSGQPTWRTAIRADVDNALARSFAWQQFIRVLESHGYEVRLDRKHPTLRPPGKERAVRFKTLGKRYTPETIRLRILYPNSHILPAGKGKELTIRYGRLRGTFPARRRLTGLRALYYRYLYELGAMPRKPIRQSAAVRQDIRKLDETVRQMEFLSTHSINTLDELETYHQPLTQKIEQATAERYHLYRNNGGKEHIAVLTNQLKALRREEKLCRQIASRSLEMQKQLEEQRRREPKQPQKPHLYYDNYER